MKRIYLILILLLCSKMILFAQDYDEKYNTRTIVINYPDSVVKVNILISEEEFKIKDELKYYWYNNDIIGCNKGGVNGKPLHGAYTVCNSDGILLAQGNFEHGLKQGKWKIWYISGEIKEIENWKDGLKNDRQKYYAENGKLFKEEKYKKGSKSEKSESTSIKSIFKKKDKEEKATRDSIDAKVEVIEEVTDI